MVQPQVIMHIHPEIGPHSLHCSCRSRPRLVSLCKEMSGVNSVGAIFRDHHPQVPRDRQHPHIRFFGNECRQDICIAAAQIGIIPRIDSQDQHIAASCCGQIDPHAKGDHQQRRDHQERETAAPASLARRFCPS